jgi:hypothetical protein
MMIGPPRATTRAASRRTIAGSSTSVSTRSRQAASKELSGNGSSLASPPDEFDVEFGCASGGHPELILRGIESGDAVAGLDQRRKEQSGAAPDIEERAALAPAEKSDNHIRD